MPGANRHRPPTVLQYVRRIYHHQLVMARQMRKRDRAGICLVDTCRRLIREKKTLLRVLAEHGLLEAVPKRVIPLYGPDCEIPIALRVVDDADDCTLEALLRKGRM